MKRTKKSFVTIIVSLVIIIIFSGCESAKDTGDYAARIIKAAEKNVSLKGIKPVDVEISDEKINIDGNSYVYIKEVLEWKEGEKIPVLDMEVPKQLADENEIAKNLICNFVSQYFDEDTAKLVISEIEKIPLVVGDFTISEATQISAFIFENGKFYVNPEVFGQLEYLPNELIIFTLVHEWVHAVRDVLLKDQNVMFYGRIPEAMTDIIAKAIYPYERKDINSYEDAYYYAYALIAKYGKDALDGYFYGFNTIEEKCGKDNLLAFQYLATMMNDEIRSDGYSDQQIFIIVTELTKEEIEKDALKLLK